MQKCLAILVGVLWAVSADAQEYEWVPAHDLVSPEQMQERLGNMQGRVAQHCQAQDRALMPCMIEEMSAMKMIVDTQDMQKEQGDITYRLRLYECLPEDNAEPLDLEAAAACYLNTEPEIPAQDP